MSSLKHGIFGTIVCLCCLAVHGREECEPGKYGDACIRNCSQGCKPFSNNEVRCHKETGECFEGCKVGVHGDRCDRPCSRNCKELTCIQQNGHCAFGCIENHFGDFCETLQEIVVHQGTTYSSHTTVTTGVAQTSSFKVIIPVVVTVLVLILIIIVLVVVIIFRRRLRMMEVAHDPVKWGTDYAKVHVTRDVEERLRPGASDPDVVEERLLPGASDPNEVEEGLRPDSSGEPLCDSLLAHSFRQCKESTSFGLTYIVERELSYTERADDQESMDEDQENVSEDGSTGSDSEEDSSQQVKLIKDFVRDPREQDVTLYVKVMKVGGMVEKSNKKQFMATVADATSAVDICVREEKLFDKFKPNEFIILKNFTWTGRVLFSKFFSTATFAAEIRVPENTIADAFGEGEPVPISEVMELPDLTRTSLRGKIVKRPPLTKRKCYGKVLSYRQVKLKDDTGSVCVDVWGDIAEQMQLGRVYKVNSCRKRKPRMPLDPWFTTTPKSTVMGLPSTELTHIRKDRYQRGTLFGIDVTPYMSCPNPKCFHFQLTDGLCDCCQSQIPDQDQVSYGVAIIHILTQKRNIHSLTAYWQELKRLFQLFEKAPPESDKEKTVKSFKDLLNKTVKYQACGIVSKFKL